MKITKLMKGKKMNGHLVLNSKDAEGEMECLIAGGCGLSLEAAQPKVAVGEARGCHLWQLLVMGMMMMMMPVSDGTDSKHMCSGMRSSWQW